MAFIEQDLQVSSHCPWWWELWLLELPHCLLSGLPPAMSLQPSKVTFPSVLLHPGQCRARWRQLPCSSVVSAMLGPSWIS